MRYNILDLNNPYKLLYLRIRDMIFISIFKGKVQREVPLQELIYVLDIFHYDINIVLYLCIDYLVDNLDAI